MLAAASLLAACASVSEPAATRQDLVRQQMLPPQAPTGT